MLLAFALASAGNVLVKGLEKKDRTTHELLLKCVIIITSVVPRQLPVQMAMAVNTALMSLMKVWSVRVYMHKYSAARLLSAVVVCSHSCSSSCDYFHLSRHNLLFVVLPSCRAASFAPSRTAFLLPGRSATACSIRRALSRPTNLCR